MVYTYCTVCGKIYLSSYENRILFCFAVPSLQPPIKSYAPIESVVRKPTTIAQVPSASHVTTGINSVQLMTSHNPTASVAVVNMGKYFYRLYLQIGQRSILDIEGRGGEHNRRLTVHLVSTIIKGPLTNQMRLIYLINQSYAC